MRIAIVNPIIRTPLSYFKIPTVENLDDAMIVDFARHIGARGHEVDLYVAQDFRPTEECPPIPNVRVQYLPTVLKRLFFPSTIPLMPSLLRSLRSARHDVVISSEVFQPSTWLAAKAKRQSSQDAQLVVWYELARYQRFLFTIPARLFYGLALRPFLDPCVDEYVPRGELARKFLADQGISPSKISEPITHGVDSGEFFPAAVREKERVIFSPSRLVPAKGIDVLLRAFRIVRESRPDLRLVIQGDGPLLEESQHLAASLEIASAVQFSTDRAAPEEMRENYCRSLLTVFASRNDNKLLAAMESVACGTPVIISTDADTHAEFLDRRGGSVFPSGDFRALASSVLALVNDEDALLRAERDALEKSQFFRNEYLYARFVDLIEARVSSVNSSGRVRGRTRDT